MDKGLPLRIPIENFIVTTDEQYPTKYKLLYFDPRGQRHEVLVRKSTVDAAISKLDGKPKAIHRSSGGISTVHPYQLVIHHHVADPVRLPPEIRIKVRFSEFAQAPNNGLTNGNTVTMTKNVLPEEVLDPIAYDLNATQKFLVDFGQGIVPVSVFGFVTDQSEENYALFVDSESIERSIRQGPGQSIPVVRYRCPKELIRAVRHGESSVELLQKAYINVERLRSLGLPIIPDALQVGPAVGVPTGLTYSGICELLRRSVHRWNRQQEDDTNVEYDTDDEGCVTSDFVMYMDPI